MKRRRYRRWAPGTRMRDIKRGTMLDSALPSIITEFRLVRDFAGTFGSGF